MARYATHDQGEVDIGETHVRVRLPQESGWRAAAILERTQDAAGRLTGLLLDRNVHGWAHSTVAEWTTTGAVTTELTRTIP